MSDYYSVTIKLTFGVMAESNEDAEELAKQLVPLDDCPRGVTVGVDAYFTPNQSERIKRGALNHE